MSDSNRPQKGARKLTIDGEEWWWMHSHYLIPIWDPEGKKTMHSVSRARQEDGSAAVTPFDIRVHIDRHIRERPEAEVQAFIKARQDRIEEERQKHLNTLRQLVLKRAVDLVQHSNQLFDEYHGGDEVDESNKAQNVDFLKHLRTLLVNRVHTYENN